LNVNDVLVNALGAKFHEIDNSILEEFLFGPFAAQKIPIVNNQGDIQKFNLDYIPIPKMSY
jgi:hypothetical protein